MPLSQPPPPAPRRDLRLGASSLRPRPAPSLSDLYPWGAIPQRCASIAGSREQTPRPDRETPRLGWQVCPSSGPHPLASTPRTVAGAHWASGRPLGSHWLCRRCWRTPKGREESRSQGACASVGRTGLGSCSWGAGWAGQGPGAGCVGRRCAPGHPQAGRAPRPECCPLRVWLSRSCTHVLKIPPIK